MKIVPANLNFEISKLSGFNSNVHLLSTLRSLSPRPPPLAYSSQLTSYYATIKAWRLPAGKSHTQIKGKRVTHITFVSFLLCKENANGIKVVQVTQACIKSQILTSLKYPKVYMHQSCIKYNSSIL